MAVKRVSLGEAKAQAKKLLDEAEAWMLIMYRDGGSSGLSIYNGNAMLFSLAEAIHSSVQFKALVRSALILEAAACEDKGGD